MGRQPYRKFYQWDANLAYFAGLMAADGCLINDGRPLNITSKDFEIIQYVKDIVDTAAKVTVRLGYFHTPAYNLTFGDVALYDFLLTIGITPAKSKTINSVAIPDIF